MARLDRLSRNAAFPLTLRDSGVDFVVVDMPEAITRRAKEALAAARARGVKLGNPNGAAALRCAGKGGAALRKVVAKNADAFAASLAPVPAEPEAEGLTFLRQIADALSARASSGPGAANPGTSRMSET